MQTVLTMQNLYEKKDTMINKGISVMSLYNVAN